MGLYGPNCQNNCSHNCAYSRRCNIKTGECIRGCQAGWKGSTCDESKALVNLVDHINIVVYWYNENVCNYYTLLKKKAKVKQKRNQNKKTM